MFCCLMTPVVEDNIIKKHYTKMSCIKQGGKIEGEGLDERSWSNVQLKRWSIKHGKKNKIREGSSVCPDHDVPYVLHYPNAIHKVKWSRFLLVLIHSGPCCFSVGYFGSFFFFFNLSPLLLKSMLNFTYFQNPKEIKYPWKMKVRT